jgi:riboflavin synthase
MFTGIIEEVGRILALDHAGTGARIGIGARIVPQDIKKGDSVAVNGVCLTVVEFGRDRFGCDLSTETLERSTLGRLGANSAVNLERALAADSRLGGHFVLGHVDGIGIINGIQPSGEGVRLAVGFGGEIARYLVFKGSVAVDGISLTVASLAERSFEIAVIPHTLAETNLKFLKPGDAVNLETDVLGKHVERLLRAGDYRNPASVWNEDYLRGQGY